MLEAAFEWRSFWGWWLGELVVEPLSGTNSRKKASDGRRSMRSIV